MSQSEKTLLDSISKLTEQLSSMEQKVDKFTGELGVVESKVDLAMTSITLVRQEQVNVTKFIKSGAGSTSSSGTEGVMGPPPTGPVPRASGAPSPPPHPSSSLLRTQVTYDSSPQGAPASEGDRGEARKHWMPKMGFPQFDGTDSRIWVDKCEAYFALYQISVAFRVSVASLHLIGPAAHWFQSYKHSAYFQQWHWFAQAVVQEFELDTHRAKMKELLSLRQTGTVDEYHKLFKQLVYNIRLYDQSLSDTMLIAQFMLGLKEDIRHSVEMMLPESVSKAAILASIQEHLLSFAKKSQKHYNSKTTVISLKTDSKPQFSSHDV
jgi:hypothetical protein